MILIQTYPNGEERVLTVTSYTLDEIANAALLITEEAAAVCISQVDLPNVWEQFTAQL